MSALDKYDRYLIIGMLFIILSDLTKDSTLSLVTNIVGDINILLAALELVRSWRQHD